MASCQDLSKRDNDEKVKRLQDEYKKYEKELKEVNDSIENLQAAVSQIVKKKEIEFDKTEKDLRDKTSYEIEDLKKKLKVAKDERKEAQKRLAKVSTSQLRNDPHGTDIHEVHPTDIAVKCSALFDNEWTQAYKYLKQTKSKQDCVIMLLNALKEVYNRCDALANENFFQQVQCCIELPFDCPEMSNEPIVMPDLLKQQIKEFRRRRAAFAIKQIQEDVVPTIHIDNGKSSVIQSYVSNCVEICWLMVIQDPPMVFEFRSDGVCSKKMFEEFSKQGSDINAIVWPAVLKHDRGKILSKGKAGREIRESESDA